jgi:hypothetical protein
MSVSPTQAVPDAPASVIDPTPRSASRKLARTYAIVIVVVVVAMVAAAYVVTGGFHSRGPSDATVLAQKDQLDSIPAEQFDAFQFIISASNTLNGTFENSYPIALYTMTPPQFEEFVKTLKISGYEWTQSIPGNNITSLNLVVSAGSWEFVFYNPSPINTTAVAFYTPFTITPS